MCQQKHSATYARISHDHHPLCRYIPFALNDHMIKFVFMHLETIDRIQFVRQYADADKVHKVQRQILIHDFLSMLIPFISFHLSSVPLCSHGIIETIYIS